MKKSTLKFLVFLMFVMIEPYIMAQAQFDITFEVDMTDADPFNPATDDVYITGSFADWTRPGNDASYKLEPVDQGSMFYSLTIAIDTGEIQYKYFRVIDNTPSWDYGEWLSSSNREVSIHQSETYYDIWGVISSDIYDITFEVDMIDANPFNPETDDVYITGSFTNWVEPGTDITYKMESIEPGSMLYTLTTPIAEGEISYKYFRIISGVPSWENGEWPGEPNREKIIVEPTVFYDIWGELSGSINITFEVDMTTAIPFNPTTDDVYISGTFANWAEPGTDITYKMEPVIGDSMNYRLTVSIMGGEIQYKYFRVIMGVPSWDNPEWNGDPNRVELIYNPIVIYDIWGDILSDIFSIPNSFVYNMYPNPVLTVLNIDNTTDVSQVDVYDATGRIVRTVEVTTAKVTIDVADLQTGVYIVNVHNDKGVQTSKFVKN